MQIPGGSVPGSEQKSANKVPCITARPPAIVVPALDGGHQLSDLQPVIRIAYGKDVFQIRHNCLLSATSMKYFTLVFVPRVVGVD